MELDFPIAVCTLAGLGLAAFSWKLIPSIETIFWGKPAKPAGSAKIVYDLLPLATLPQTQAA
ncbi:MAG: hypothetical protein IT578_11040 [Verrucomicrobiae bacterium]|nr:hypothetical protein [Verrucomicrobiae bacterium]